MKKNYLLLSFLSLLAIIILFSNIFCIYSNAKPINNPLLFDFEQLTRINFAKLKHIKSITNYEVELNCDSYTLNEKIFFYEEYNKAANIIKTQIFNDGNEIEKFEYKYDSIENILEIYSYKDRQLSSYSKYEYFDQKIVCKKYNDLMMYYKFTNPKTEYFKPYLIPNEYENILINLKIENLPYDQKMELFYGKDNNLVSRLDYINKLLSSETKYTYDYNNNIIKEMHKVRSSSLAIGWNYYTSTLEYNNLNKLINDIYTNNESKKWQFINLREYSYDQKGMLLSKKIVDENYDSTDINIYFYDNYNRIIKDFTIIRSKTFNNFFPEYYFYNDYISYYDILHLLNTSKEKRKIIKVNITCH